MRLSARMTVAVLAAAVLLFAVPAVTLAHGHRHVGDYMFTVGFFVEPAYEGEKNGVDLRVTHHHDEEPVLGLEATLQVEISLADGGSTRVLPLRAVWGQPGRYTADFVPTATGAYTFRFFGTVESLEVDESFTSTEDSFSSVEPIADLQFPEQVASARQLQAATTGAVEAASAAEDAAATAATRANIALAVGVLGVLAGLGGIAFGLRKQSA